MENAADFAGAPDKWEKFNICRRFLKTLNGGGSMSDIEVEGQFFVPSGNCFFCLVPPAERVHPGVGIPGGRLFLHGLD